jgi:hypothetical protein
MPLNASPAVSVTPSPTKELTSTNYITTFDFTNQWLPDTIKEEFKRYGNQSIKGFLSKMSAEIPSSSDLIKWSEEGRIRAVATGVTRTANVFTLSGHRFRNNDTIVFNDGAVENVGIVTANDATTFTVAPTKVAGWTIGTTAINCFAFGSEYRKGTVGQTVSLEANPAMFENKMIIIKDVDIVNGSDMAQVGWIEVDGDNGKGYLWYLKSRAQTRQRFDDVLEMSMLENVSFESGSTAGVAGFTGSQGFFSAAGQGNVFDGIVTTLADFDTIFDRLNKQGGVSEYMMFNNFAQEIAVDNMLGAVGNGYSGGVSYGAFQNNEQMALNLGFTGFKRAGYEVYKSQWKYLNDITTRGGFAGVGKVNGVLCPHGTKNVYDEIAGEKRMMPYLHAKYRAAQGENRKYKTWAIGGAGGASNSSLDANELHFLSERALITQGRNAFVLLKG